MVKTRIKRGDVVVVITGKDKGKIGKVLSFTKDKSKVFVENVNIVKKHKKSENPENKQPNIIEKSMPIHISNVMYYVSSSGKGERIRYEQSGEKKTRVTVKSKHTIS